MIYDVIVVGGGSSGVHTSYFLKELGAKVALVEQNTIASGGSGAAGAFITPRLGRGGPIQRFSNEAFKFCIHFYKNSSSFYQTGLLRLPKEGESFEGLERFLEGVRFEKKEGGFYFADAGVLEAKSHLEVLLKGIPCYFFEASVEKREDYFLVGDLRAKRVVLATGAWDKLIGEPYIKIGKTSGVRFDIETSLSLPYSMHKKISISKNVGGRVAIGATHHRLENPNPPKSPLWLFEEAKRMVGDFDYKIKEMFCGIRSSVDDHLPLFGELIDAARVGKVKNIKRLDTKLLPKKGIFIINGLGGRGFVFGPYIGKLLAEHLLNGAEIPKELSVDRYFLRYLKKGRV